MTCCNDVADYDWLTGAEAAALLDELAASQEPLHAMAARLRRHYTQVRTHLLLEQVELRRRAVVKFTRANLVFFTRTSLEQATDQWVAEYKAARLAGRGLIFDLCCGIGGDLLALANQGQVVGVDRYRIATRLAAANARAVLATDHARHVAIETGDVESCPISGAATWHIDPDRRCAGRRTTSLDRCSPGQRCMERLLSQVPHAAMKLAPATVVPPEWERQCELEWIGRGRQCRQLVAWHGDLAQQPGWRRATVLPGPIGSIECESSNEQIAAPGGQNLTARSVVGHAGKPVPIADGLERFVFEPHPAVLAARLTGTLAAEHGLAALTAGPTYLTGSEPVADPALACFEVEGVLPMKLRLLAAYLRKRGVGQLEIKKRGVEIEPEQVWRALRLRGDHAATLLLTRIAGQPAAILARRVSSTSDRIEAAVARPPGEF